MSFYYNMSGEKVHAFSLKNEDIVRLCPENRSDVVKYIAHIDVLQMQTAIYAKLSKSLPGGFIYDLQGVFQYDPRLYGGYAGQ